MVENKCTITPALGIIFRLLFVPIVFMLPALVTAQASPMTDAVVTSVTSVDGGRYNLAGIVLDDKGKAACGLAMASGRCVFSCGPGSMRCEGGQANLQLGQFELFNLPTEADGTITLQAFVQGHVSYVGHVNPGDFDGPDVPPPSDDISTYEGSEKGEVSEFYACATLSAAGDALVSDQGGRCDGDHSLDIEIEVEIDGDGLGSERCSISFDTDDNIFIENGAFIIETSGNELISGQFVSPTRLVGTAFDEDCGGSWYADLIE
jgi:hypothetical protein